MPRTDTDQVFDGNGNVLSSTTVVRPVPTVSAAEYQQARATLRSMITTFYPGGVATGTPTAVQVRNWLLALTAGMRFMLRELDDE